MYRCSRCGETTRQSFTFALGFPVKMSSPLSLRASDVATLSSLRALAPVNFVYALRALKSGEGLALLDRDATSCGDSGAFLHLLCYRNNPCGTGYVAPRPPPSETHTYTWEVLGPNVSVTEEDVGGCITPGARRLAAGTVPFRVSSP
jgi:hypothetical protein